MTILISKLTYINIFKKNTIKLPIKKKTNIFFSKTTFC